MIENPTAEILERTADTPADRFRVITAPHPFSFERREMHLPEGGTIGDIVAVSGIPKGCTARVFVGDRLVTEEWWPRVRPRKGSIVTIRAVPMDGGGGQGQDRNKTLRVVLQIVIVIAAAVLIAATGGLGSVYAPWILAGAAALQIGVALLLPPSFAKPKGRDNRDGLVSSITGSRNVANKGGAITKVFGRARCLLPDMVDEPLEIDAAPLGMGPYAPAADVPPAMEEAAAA
jgi:hypothetical protein